jgi:hypothetical protein
MNFFITCDAHKDSGLNELLNVMDLDEYFSEKQYDDSATELAVILMCRDPYLNFKQRIRFSKAENCLYMDIMLDLDQMKNASPERRKRIVAEKLVTEVPQIIKKYKFRDFDLKRFSSDLIEWFEKHGWINGEGELISDSES